MSDWVPAGSGGLGLTCEEALRWARKFSLLSSDGAKLIHIKHLIEKAVLAERERCAKIADAMAGVSPERIAPAIRSGCDVNVHIGGKFSRGGENA